MALLSKHEIRRPLQSVERVRLPSASQQQPASSNPPAAASQPSQPAKPASQASQASQPSQPASQASQPANVASGHRSIRPPGIRHRCLRLGGSLRGGDPIGCHRLPQAATGRHSPPQVPKPSGTRSTWGSQTCYKPIKYRRYGELPSKSCGGVMGRLWDDHFRDLGYPPRFYRVQDAGFIHGSSI